MQWLTQYTLGRACAGPRASWLTFLTGSHMVSSAILLTDCDRPYVGLLVTIPETPRNDERVIRRSKLHLGHKPIIHIRRKKIVRIGPAPLQAEEPGVPLTSSCYNFYMQKGVPLEIRDPQRPSLGRCQWVLSSDRPIKMLSMLDDTDEV